ERPLRFARKARPIRPALRRSGAAGSGAVIVMSALVTPPVFDRKMAKPLSVPCGAWKNAATSDGIVGQSAVKLTSVVVLPTVGGGKLLIMPVNTSPLRAPSPVREITPVEVSKASKNCEPGA